MLKRQNKSLSLSNQGKQKQKRSYHTMLLFKLMGRIGFLRPSGRRCKLQRCLADKLLGSNRLSLQAGLSSYSRHKFKA
mgnify:CR=1 FL=1